MSHPAGSEERSHPRFAEFRTGIGYDSHRFGTGGRMMLGGVEVATGIRLTGHSDGDAVAHAVTDAVLGASGSQHDIGSLFPDTDPANKDRDSIDMLRIAVAHAMERGCTVINADVTVVTEHPRIGRHRDAIRESLAAALGVSRESVGIKGKTNEGMGWIGRGEGLACIAVVTVGLERNAGGA